MNELSCYCPVCNIHGHGHAYSNCQIKIIRDCDCGHCGNWIRMYLKAPYEEVTLTQRLKIPMGCGSPIYIEAGCTVIYEIKTDGSKVIRKVTMKSRR